MSRVKEVQFNRVISIKREMARTVEKSFNLLKFKERNGGSNSVHTIVSVGFMCRRTAFSVLNNNGWTYREDDIKDFRVFEKDGIVLQLDFGVAIMSIDKKDNN